MATFFGEILPVFSRAVDDDEDDDDFAPKPRQLVLEWNGPDCDNLPISGDTLLVTVGEVAWCFAELYYYLNDSNKLAVMKEVQNDDDDCGFEAVSKKPKVVTTIYNTTDCKRGVIFAVCRTYVPPEQIWPFTVKLFENVKHFKDVFVLSSSTLSEYKCEDTSSIGTPFVRSLSTTIKPVCHPVFPALEQPNMLKDIPAALITYCQYHGLAGVAYVCYAENIHLDLSSIQAFTKLLETPQFKVDVKPDVTRKILQTIRNSSYGKGLYT